MIKTITGTPKQVAWCKKILAVAALTDGQIDSLLRFAGPKMYASGSLYAPIVIDNRNNLGAYANSLNQFYGLSAVEKHAVAQAAACAVGQLAQAHVNGGE